MVTVRQWEGITAMMPQMGQEPGRPPDPGELVDQARAALAASAPARAELLRRSAAGDGNARVLLAEMVVLRDFAAKTEAAWFAATVSAEGELLRMVRENARLRAELEAARPSRRGRHAGDRPLWPRAVRGAAPLSVLPVLPAGLRHAGALLGHHAAAKALAGTAVAASAVLVIGAGAIRPVPYQTPAPAGHSAPRAPSADPYAAVRIPSGARAASPAASPAARSASPVPSAVPSPRASTPPPSLPPSPPPPAVPVPPALTVPRLLDLGASTRGLLALSAGQSVTWTLSATDGITVLAEGRPVTGGTLAAGQELDLVVTAPLGEGWVYVSFGGTTVPVEVTSDLGSPPLALPG